jgi:hypothetical protein
MFGRSEQKRHLESIRVLGSPPVDPESWKHVLEYFVLLKCLREMSQRWNALASELSLEAVPGDKPEDALVAAESFRIHLKVKEMAALQVQVGRAASLVFPTWPHSREMADNARSFTIRSHCVAFASEGQEGADRRRRQTGLA